MQNYKQIVIKYVLLVLVIGNLMLLKCQDVLYFQDQNHKNNKLDKLQKKYYKVILIINHIDIKINVYKCQIGIINLYNNGINNMKDNKIKDSLD